MREVVTFEMATKANKCFSLKSNLTSIKPIWTSNFETNFNWEKMSQTLLMTRFSTGWPLQTDVLGREHYLSNNAFWLVEFREAHRLLATIILETKKPSGIAVRTKEEV